MPVTPNQVQKGTRVESLNFGWVEVVNGPYESGLKRGNLKVDVKFDSTNTVRVGVEDRFFLGGYVRDGSVDAPTSQGSIYNTFEDGPAVILDFTNSRDVTVSFLHTRNIQTVHFDALVKGVIRDVGLVRSKEKLLLDEKTKRAELQESLRLERTIASELKTKAWQNYLQDAQAKRDEEERKLKLTKDKREASRLQKLSNLDKVLEATNKVLDQEKCLDDIVNIDFKDRDGNWVLRFNLNGKFMQTRLGRLHNNLTQRVKKGGSYSRFSNAYVGVGISELFRKPQSFCDWVVEQDGWGYGYHIDKDLLSPQNKIYSEETCVFLPSEINMALIPPKKTVVALDANGYYTLNLRLGGKEIIVPGFTTKEIALKNYREYREKYVQKLACEYNEAISDRAYQALLNWKLKVYDY